MPPVINVEVMIWFTHNGEERFSSFEKQMFITDVEWVCRQYAEVNNGECRIFHGEEKIAHHRV